MIDNFFVDNARVRAVWIKKTLHDIPAKQTILDAGAGEMQYKKYCNHLQYRSQDFCQYEGSGNSVGLQTGTWDTKQIDIIGDIIDIPVEDESYDNILCTEVFEHIPYPDKAIKEFSRILKKGGKLIITAPFCSFTHFAPYYFCNGFSEYWFKKHLNDNGFGITELEKNGNYFDFLEQEVLRIGYMAKQYTGTNAIFIFFFRIVGLIQILILKYLSMHDTGSNEILNSGTHLVAIKN